MTGRNRVQERIGLIQAKIDKGDIPKEKLDRLGESLKTDFGDLFQYQNLQAMAHAQGLLTFEEANQIYRLLGGEAPSATKWDKLSLPERVAITQVMSELLSMKLGATKRSSSSKSHSRKPSSRLRPSFIKEVR